MTAHGARADGQLNRPAELRERRQPPSREGQPEPAHGAQVSPAAALSFSVNVRPFTRDYGYWVENRCADRSS